jgi:hypothetical protein
MKIIYRIHAIERMFERGIGIKEVRAAMETGENIEVYADATEYPARLVLARKGRRPLHVVAADNIATDEIIVITSYRPDPNRWTEDFKRRRDEVLDV